MNTTLRVVLALGLNATILLHAGSALKSAASRGNLDAIRSSLATGENINDADANGWTPLMWAIRNRHISATNLLLESGADPNRQATDSCKSYPKGATALTLAAADGQEESIKALHHKNAKLDLSDVNGWTPLAWATYYRQFSSVNLLLGLGANPNSQTTGDYESSGINIMFYPRGTTALMLAARDCQEDLVKSLIFNKANKDLSDSNNETASSYARRFECPTAMRVLGLQPGINRDLNELLAGIDRGKSVNAVDKIGWTPLMWSVFYRDIATTLFLLQKGADPNLQTTGSFKSFVKGATALIIAAYDGQDDQVRALLLQHAQINQADSSGKTAVSYARQFQMLDVLRTLGVPANENLQTMLDRVRAGQHVDALDDSGWTPLMWAVHYGDHYMIDVLLELGANPNMQSARAKKSYPQGTTPLMIAATFGLEDSVRAFLKRKALINLMDSTGQTAVDYARKQKCLGVLSLFGAPANATLQSMLDGISAGKDVNSPDKNGWTPLMWAVYYGDLHTTKNLLNRGADPNIQSTHTYKGTSKQIFPKGSTALIITCKRYDEDRNLAEALLLKNANTKIADSTDNTAMSYAINNGFIKIPNMLYDHFPLPETYSNLVMDHFGSTQQFTQDYAWAIKECRQSAITSIQEAKTINLVERTAAGSLDTASTLLLSVQISDLRILSAGERDTLRRWARDTGDIYIHFTVELKDAATGKIQRKESLRFVNSGWNSADEQKKADTSFAKDAGTFLANYLISITKKIPSPDLRP